MKYQYRYSDIITRLVHINPPKPTIDIGSTVEVLDPSYALCVYKKELVAPAGIIQRGQWWYVLAIEGKFPTQNTLNNEPPNDETHKFNDTMIVNDEGIVCFTRSHRLKFVR